MKTLPLLLLTTSLSLGCDANQASRDAESVVERSPLAKADATGSCAAPDGASLCGGQSEGACWCDAECSDYGDCCADVAPVCGFGADDTLTDDDREEIAKLITQVVYPAFGGAPGSEEALRGALTDDARLLFVKKEAEGRDDFVTAIQDSFAQENKAFATAVANYQFLVRECGMVDEGLRPIGLPDSVDIETFDPTQIGPETFAAHPGLAFPRFELIADLSGKHLAVSRFSRMATFAHSWMPRGATDYPFVDRFVVEKKDGEIRVREYEFSMDYDDFPGWPEPITSCPTAD